MTTKKLVITKEEVEEQSLSFMFGEISNIAKNQRLILDTMIQIKGLQQQNAEKGRKTAVLVSRLTEPEQDTRIMI